MPKLVVFVVFLLAQPAVSAADGDAGTPASIDAGRHAWDRTLVIGHDRQGWSLQGSGFCHPSGGSPWADVISSGATVLCWNGGAEGRMIHARGAHWRISDMTLLGWPTQRARDQAGRSPGATAGIWVQQQGRFIGAKAHVERVALAGFDAAVLLGNPEKIREGGNDNLSLEKVYAHRCGALLQVAGNQACATAISNWHTRRVGTVVLASGGGDVTLRDGDCDNDTTLISVTGGGRQVGAGNGFFTIDGLKVDPRIGLDLGTLTLVDVAQPSAVVYATLRDIRVFPSRTRVRARLSGGRQRLLLSDVKNLPTDTRWELHNGATVVIEHSDTPATAEAMMAESSTAGRVLLLNCWRNGEPVRREEALR